MRGHHGYGKGIDWPKTGHINAQALCNEIHSTGIKLPGIFTFEKDSITGFFLGRIAPNLEPKSADVEQLLALYQPVVNAAYKPVIYLYPKEETDVSVKLILDGKLTCTYPAYNTGWNVTVAPDGTLADAKGQTYNYLYWEGETNAQWDMPEGFCVKGEDTAAFLEEALEKLGLNRREANEYIVYWLPLMEQNPFNVISFQTDIYIDAAELQIDPAPDTLIRIFMA